MITFLFGQSEAKCPNPWHLKHLLVIIGLGLGLVGGGWTFCRARVLCGLEGKGFVGLGGGLEGCVPA